jgi:hypothetical protein
MADDYEALYERALSLKEPGAGKAVLQELVPGEAA